MSVKPKRRHNPRWLECGLSMSKHRSRWTDLLSVFIASVVMLFSYAALLENGILHAVAGFIFGFVFLFYLNDQTFDRFYIHIGRVKIGGDAYDPESESKSDEESECVTVEYPKNERE